MSLLKKFIKDPLFISVLIIAFLEFLLKTKLPFLKYLFFPTIGALIGYITNVLAVWMIFNPKKPVLGWQGIVPKSKHRIAENLSTTIEKELVNPRLIQEYLKTKEEAIKEELIEVILDATQELPSLVELMGEEKFRRFEDFLIELYHKYQPSFLDLIMKTLLSLAKKPLNDLIPSNIYLQLKEAGLKFLDRNYEKFQERTIDEILSKQTLEDIVRNLFSQIDEQALKNLYTYLASKSLYELYPRTEIISQKLIEFFVQKLKEPSFRYNLARLITQAIKNREVFLEKIFIELADMLFDLEQRIANYLEEIANRIEEDPEIIREIEDTVRDFLKKPIGEYLSEEKFVYFAKRSLKLIEPEIETIARLIGSKPLKSFLSRGIYENLKFKLSSLLDNFYFNSEDTVLVKVLEENYGAIREFFKGLLSSSKVEEYLRKNLQRLVISRVEPIKLFKTEENYKQFLLEVIEEFFPYITKGIEFLVQKIEVKKIVKQKIESYTVEEMEEVVFGVMKREFRYIEILGLPIGFVVGLIQLVVR